MPLIYNEATGDFDDVAILPNIKTFKIASGRFAYEGDMVELAWSVENATRIYLDGEEVSGSNRKLLNISTAGTKTFVLTAENEDGSTNKDVSLVVYKRPLINVHASPTTLHMGRTEQTTISWSISDGIRAQLCYGNERVNIPMTGSRSFSQTEDTTYSIVVVGNDGSRSFYRPVSVLVREEATVEFTISRRYTFPNISVQLSWNVKGASRVSIDGFGTQPLKGELTVSPCENTTYVLRYYDAFGVHTCSRAIHILPIPQIKTVMVPAPDLTVRMPLQVTMSRAMVDVKIPDIGVDTVDITAPMAHVCTDIGAGIMIRTFSPIGLKTIGRAFGRLYNRIIKHNKITNNE